MIVYKNRYWTDSAMVPRYWDTGAYDDILATIRRQGFFDPMGCDMVPSRYDNGDTSPVLARGSPAEARWKAERAREKAAAEHYAKWQAEQRAKQEERERISALEWEAAERKRREPEPEPEWQLSPYYAAMLAYREQLTVDAQAYAARLQQASFTWRFGSWGWKE